MLELLLSTLVFVNAQVEPSATATGYRWYVATARHPGTMQFEPKNYQIKLELKWCMIEETTEPQSSTWGFDLELGEMLMVIATAFNEHGESDTEHGPTQGMCDDRPLP